MVERSSSSTHLGCGYTERPDGLHSRWWWIRRSCNNRISVPQDLYRQSQLPEEEVDIPQAPTVTIDGPAVSDYDQFDSTTTTFDETEHTWDNNRVYNGDVQATVGVATTQQFSGIVTAMLISSTLVVDIHQHQKSHSLSHHSAGYGTIQLELELTYSMRL